MADISTIDARALFTVDVVDAFDDLRDPSMLFSTFFREDVTPTKNISIEVTRNSEKVAVDIIRSTEGTRNTFSRQTEKIWQPPMFDEFFDITELDLYDNLYAQPTISGAAYGRLVLDAAQKMRALRNKIDRAYELMRSQALISGIVTLKSADQIDFRRKAASLIDLAATYGGYWTTNGVDPFDQIRQMCQFIIKTGKASGKIFNLILGDTAIQALYRNDVFLARQNLFNMRLDYITAPQEKAEGATFHGTMTCGPYTVNLWCHNGFYQDSSNVMQPFMTDNYGILLPSNPHFTMAYAAVPQLLLDGNGPYVGKFKPYEHIDTRKAIHQSGLQSAGMPVLTAVDQVVSFKARA